MKDANLHPAGSAAALVSTVLAAADPGTTVTTSPGAPAATAPTVVNASAEQLAAAAATATANERARISGILGADAAKGRETLAKHLAFESDMSAEAATKILAASPEAAPAAPAASGSPLDRAMQRAAVAPAGAAAPVEPVASASAVIDMSAIYGAREKAQGAR